MRFTRVCVFILFGVLSVFTGCGGGGGGSNNQTPPSSAKAITSFLLAGVSGTISEADKTIVVHLPSGSTVTALVATFATTGASVSVGATPQISGVTPNNFTNPVVYTVVAADSTTVSYTVTVTVLDGFLYIGYPNFVLRVTPSTGATISTYSNLGGATAMAFGQ